MWSLPLIAFRNHGKFLIYTFRLFVFFSDPQFDMNLNFFPLILKKDLSRGDFLDNNFTHCRIFHISVIFVIPISIFSKIVVQIYCFTVETGVVYAYDSWAIIYKTFEDVC